MTLEAEAWVELAEIDYDMAGRAAGPPKALLAAVCYHAQQCAEQYLKAALAEAGRPISRTHDLGALLLLVVDLLPDLADEEEELRAIGPYAVAMRYPGASVPWGDLTDDVVLAVTTAQAVRSVTRAFLGLPPDGER